MSSTSDPIAPSPQGRPFIEPSTLGQFIALDGCPQYFEYEFADEFADRRRNEKDWKEAFEPLSLLLAKAGREFETETIHTLTDRVQSITHHAHITDWNESKSALADAIETAYSLEPGTDPVVLTEVRFGIQIEAWPVAGDADIVALWPTDAGVKIRVIEIKAANEEKTYHQLQVAVYTLLCKQFLEELNPEFRYEIEGGVIHNGTDITGTEPDSLPSFPLESREMDVRRLLKHGGQLDELLYRDPELIDYQLAPKCHNCAYKESCFTDAIENEKPALLGLTRGEQAILKKHNITSLHDLAELAYPPNDPRPYEYDAITPAKRTKYEELTSEPGIGERLPEYVQRAQAMLKELDPESMYTPNSRAPAPWLVGSGNGELPEDDPGFADEHLSIERGSLIRCYVHVEWDHRSDRIVMLSSYVTATNYAENPENDPQEHAVLTEGYATTDAEADRFERNLLIEFFEKLFQAIRTVGEGMGRETHAPVHLYCYAKDERATLIDAVRRHNSEQIVTAARDLLGLRGAIDQSMISVVQNELRSRVALPINNLGLLPTMRYFHPDEDFFPQSEWNYERLDGTVIDLRDAFHYKLFDYNVPYSHDNTGITLYPDTDPDGFYPSRARQGSHIPLEYVWGALGRLNDDWTDSISEEYNLEQSVTPFRWIDRETKTTRIEPGDLQALGSRFARCLAHIERGIRYRNAGIEKHPINLPDLEVFSLGEGTIGRACREYLRLEHRSQRRDLLGRYGLPVRQRIQRGDAIPFVVTAAEEPDSGRLRVEGRLLYDEMFPEGDRVAGACRQKGASGDTGGSWMVANELDRQGEPKGSPKPRTIERGPGVMIEELDMDERYIRISSIPVYLPADQEFRRRHRQWTTDPGDESEQVTYFEEDRIFVLDPRSDDLTAQRAFDVLVHAENSFLTSSLEDLASGEKTNPETDAFSEDSVTAFIDWLLRSQDHAPNERQQEFIRDCTAQFSLLHGPPGTGKTSGALANATIARLAAFASTDKQFTGVVTAESNKAVNELLEDITTVIQQYETDPSTEEDFGDVRLVRLTGEPPSDPAARVEYLDYHSDRTALRSLVRHLTADSSTPQQSILDTTQNTAVKSQPHVLVFGTPARIFGLVNRFDTIHEERMSPADWVQADESFFDALVVDEASMMRLPSFLLAGSFLHDHAQVLIGGDHRQLPPVQQHDWQNETRRTITEFVPYLSTLDYFRALRGADLDELAAECQISGDATIPFYRLERTYRCHQDITGVLRRQVYEEDNVTFRSNQTETIADPAPATQGVNITMDPKSSLTLVVHHDQSSQQSNRLEAALGAAFISVIREENDTGIVTPHNAQRGLVGTLVPGNTEVETVERYQGGERDCIIVSATASDPDFLRAEREFILNPNRLNVAMSRMRQKLVVIASQSVFELVPPEVDQYDRAGLWKGLFTELGVIDRDPDWTGPLHEITQPTSDKFDIDKETRVSVYSFPP